MKKHTIKNYFYFTLVVFVSVFAISCGSFPGTSCGGSVNFGEKLLEDSSNNFFAENDVPTNQTFVNKNGTKRTYTRSKSIEEKFIENRLICEDADQLKYGYLTGEKRLIEFTSFYDNDDDTYGYEIRTEIVKDKEGNPLVIDLFFLYEHFIFITSMREHGNINVYIANSEPSSEQIGVYLPFHKDTTILGKTFFNVYHSVENNDMLFSEGVGVVALIDKNVLWVLDE